MRILVYTLGVTAAAALVASPVAAGPGQHGPKAPTSHTTTVQTHGNPHATTTGKPTTTTPTTGTMPPLNPIAAKISSHPQLASKLSSMLPKGMTLNQASAGFKNQGQFIAALHVSQNLNIPFKDLRTQMVTDHKSLGQSIQTLRKTTDADDAVHVAEHEADDDVKTTTTPSTTTSKPGSTTTKKKDGK